MPDSGKSLDDNLADLSNILSSWSVYLAGQATSLPEESPFARMKRATLRAIAGGLMFSSREAARLAHTTEG